MDQRVDQNVINLYDQFTHGYLNRRDFLDRLARLVGGSAAALALLPLLRNDYDRHLIAEQDDRLEISRAEWDVGNTTMFGYMARLKGGDKRPAVIVIHENRGLNAHIEDVTRRMALEGFLALAPDALAPLGGTPDDEGRAREMMRELNADDTLAGLSAAVPFLAGHLESTGKVGVVGFCWGGGYANQLAAAGTSLNAAVPYYGRQLPVERVPEITAPLCLQYAGLDERINAGIPGYEAALKANNKQYELHIYEGVNHAFNNDTNDVRYDKEAADLAWSRTIAFFKKHLAG